MVQSEKDPMMPNPEMAAEPVKTVAEGSPKSSGRGRSPSQLLWLKLRRNRTAMIGLYVLAIFYLASILAGFIAPYRYDNARHDLPFYPPMLARIHIFDEEGHLTRPFVYHLVPVDPQVASYRDDTSRKYPIRLFARSEE